MSAPLLALPGVRVEHRACEAGFTQRLHTALDLMHWRIGGALAARRIRKTLAANDPAAIRRLAAELRQRWEQLSALPVAQMNTMTAGVFQQRLARDLVRFTWMEEPGRRDAAAILYVPGGSFTVPRSPQLTAMVCAIARRTQLPVMVCDYRLAPEHPYPAAVDDVVSALRHMISSGIDPASLAIAAESCGAAIALAATQRLAAEGVRLGALAFLSPWVDLTLPNSRTHDLTRLCASLYLGETDPRDPAASPVFGSFKGLPQMVIHGSKGDPLFGDSVRLAETAARAGLEVTLRVWPGGMHVMERYLARDGERSIEDISAFLRATIARQEMAA